MECATQPAILQPAEREIGAAMRAMPLDQAVPALLIAKQHQILAEQFDGLDRTRAGQFIDQRRRLPVHPHQFPARRFGPGAGDQVVLFLAHHGGMSFPSGNTVESSITNANLLALANSGKRISCGIGPRRHWRELEALSREERATDFIESLDRGLRELEGYGVRGR